MNPAPGRGVPGRPPGPPGRLPGAPGAPPGGVRRPGGGGIGLPDWEIGGRRRPGGGGIGLPDWEVGGRTPPGAACGPPAPGAGWRPGAGVAGRWGPSGRLGAGDATPGAGAPGPPVLEDGAAAAGCSIPAGRDGAGRGAGVGRGGSGREPGPPEGRPRGPVPPGRPVTAGSEADRGSPAGTRPLPGPGRGEPGDPMSAPPAGVAELSAERSATGRSGLGATWVGAPGTGVGVLGPGVGSPVAAAGTSTGELTGSGEPGAFRPARGAVSGARAPGGRLLTIWAPEGRSGRVGSPGSSVAVGVTAPLPSPAVAGAAVVGAAVAGAAVDFAALEVLVGWADSSSGWTSRRSPSRSALRRTRSACWSSRLEEWLLTPIPREVQRSRASLLVSPSSRASS